MSPWYSRGGPRGGCSPMPPSRQCASIREPSPLTLRKIGPACGPRVYLRCSTSRAKYYASVLLCDHPDDAPRRTRALSLSLRARAKGLWLRARSVFTRWHTPSDLLHARYTLYTGLPKPKVERETERERGRKRKRVRWYSR